MIRNGLNSQVWTWLLTPTVYKSDQSIIHHIMQLNIQLFQGTIMKYLNNCFAGQHGWPGLG